MVSVLHYSIVFALICAFIFVEPVQSSKRGDSCYRNCNNNDPTNDNALYCNTATGVCDCEIPSDNDTSPCVKWKVDGESCQDSKECNPHRSLTCVEGHCGCDPETTIMNREYFTERAFGMEVHDGVCGYKVGLSCDIERDRRQNTYNRFCHFSAYCHAGICTCLAGPNAQTASGKCGVSYKQTCSSNVVCYDQFRCLFTNLNDSPRCQCPQPSYQKYDENTETCQSLLDAPCDRNSTIPCIKGAECVESEPFRGKFKCQCKNGTVETADGKCQVQHGWSCEFGDERTAVLCNQEAVGLVCKSASPYLSSDFKCACENDDDVFEESLNRCSRRLGVRCIESEEIHPCIANAKCESKWKRNWGICRCENKFNETEDGVCLSKPSSRHEYDDY